mgnify:CR=1 FL=1
MCEAWGMEDNHGYSVKETFQVGFVQGANWQAEQSIEILSSVLENWVHGGDADCIIAEFEEKLNNK